MNYSEWVNSVPPELTGDPLWRVEAYRLALFAAALGWFDVTRLLKDKRTLGLADQLYSALGSIGANISEGYSRGTGKDRARFYEYALGSTRESRTWYFDGRHVLGEIVTTHRLRLLTQIIRLLLKMVPDERGYFVHDETTRYRLDEADSQVDAQTLSGLLQDLPMP